jgi:hypothetical protein
MHQADARGFCILENDRFSFLAPKLQKTMERAGKPDVYFFTPSPLGVDVGVGCISAN